MSAANFWGGRVAVRQTFSRKGWIATDVPTNWSQRDRRSNRMVRFLPASPKSCHLLSHNVQKFARFSSLFCCNYPLRSVDLAKSD